MHTRRIFTGGALTLGATGVILAAGSSLAGADVHSATAASQAALGPEGTTVQVPVTTQLDTGDRYVVRVTLGQTQGNKTVQSTSQSGFIVSDGTSQHETITVGLSPTQTQPFKQGKAAATVGVSWTNGANGGEFSGPVQAITIRK